ncbi:MAG: tetratricopeptide repeat protein, partial [Cyanobacteria bacterium J06649_11]
FKRTGHERTAEAEAHAIALTEELGGLPLALEQAGAYLHSNKAIPFQVYLRRYREEGVSELNQRLAATGKYPLSVLKTWDINFEVIRKDYQVSARILELCCFLAPDRIPSYIAIFLMMAMFEDNIDIGINLDDYDDLDEDEALAESMMLMERLLEPLRRYSLIKALGQAPLFNIHRMVQAVVLDNISRENIAQCLKYLGSSLMNYLNSLYDHNRWGGNMVLFPHLNPFLKHTEKENFINSDVVHIVRKFATMLSERGDFSNAESMYKASIFLAKENLSEHDNYEALIGSNKLCLGNHYLETREYEKAKTPLVDALHHINKLGDDYYSMLGSIYIKLAFLYREEGDIDRYSTAMTSAEQILDIINKEPSEVSAETTAAFGGELLNSEQYEKAIEYLKFALEITKNKTGNESITVARLYENLAVAYLKIENYGLSATASRKSIRIKRELLLPTNPALAEGLEQLGSIYTLQQRFDEAIPPLEEAL